MGIEDRLHARHTAEQLGDRARGDVAHQPATGAMLLGQDGRSRWRELALETVAEKEPPARSVDDVVAVFAPGEEQMRPLLPAHPHLDDALVPIPPQPEVAVRDIELRPLAAQQLFEGTEHLRIATRDLQRQDAPFDVGPRDP